jgi:tetratricopeptide (TPR) repeat protein
LAPHELVLQKPLVQDVIPRQGGFIAERQLAARDVSTSDVDPRRVDFQSAAHSVSIEHCIDDNTRHPMFANLTKSPADVCPTLSQEAMFPSDWHEVSHATAAKALRDSRNFYQLKQYDQAIELLHMAIRLDADNAEYHFVLAIIQYQRGRNDEAEQSVITAVALEEQQPVENWGDSMQRFQGAARVWLEDTRRRLRTQ